MRSFGLVVYFLFLAAVVTVGVFFAKYNSEPIILKFFYLRSLPMAQWLIVFISITAGFLLAVIMMSWKLITLYVSRKKYIKLYEQIKAMLEQKINDIDKDTHN